MITVNDMSRLSRTMIAADEKVKEVDAALKRAKERARELREETIPCAMQELGLTKLVLDTGEQLTVKQDVYASIPVNQRNAAFKWLDDNNFGGIIKTTVSVQYDRGEAEQALDLSRELLGRGINATMKNAVNPQTLKAFLRDEISKGNENLPLEIFGARPVWVAKVK